MKNKHAVNMTSLYRFLFYKRIKTYRVEQFLVDLAATAK